MPSDLWHLVSTSRLLLTQSRQALYPALGVRMAEDPQTMLQELHILVQNELKVGPARQ